MSAYYVGEDHINAMLTYAETLRSSLRMPDGSYGEATDANLTLIGRELIKENCLSLRSCYPHDWKELMPDNWGGVESYEYKPDYYWITHHPRNAALSAIKLCHCYEYQACEHEAWESSYAYKFSHWLADRATSNLPGYDDADWRYSKPIDAPTVISLSRMAK